MSPLPGTISPAEHALNSADRFVGQFSDQQFAPQVPASPEVIAYDNDQAQYDAEFTQITDHPELQAAAQQAEAAVAADLAVPSSTYNMYRTPTTEQIQPAPAQPETPDVLDGRRYNVGDVQTEALNAAHAILLARHAVTQEFSSN